MRSNLMALALALFFLSPLLLGGLPLYAEESGKWKGFDEAVLERLAEEHGRKPQESIILLEGDLELFMFSVLAGLSGFVAGFYFRKIFGEGLNAYPQREKN